MDCPSCGKSIKNNNKVLECRTFKNSQSIRRRRQCECGHRFTTREYTSLDLEDLLLLREMMLPETKAVATESFLENMIEDLKTAILNARKVKDLLHRGNKKTKTLLFGIKGGKK
tara:strand:- start:264 stop:605 length:342 start_codon:yes stop_codon:yes gene_type:complete